MTAYVVDPTPDVAELLRQFEAQGGILEFFFITVDGDTSGDDERHRIAAELALHLVQQKLDAWGGREWWGTFYWTVQTSKHEPIVAILGSSTD